MPHNNRDHNAQETPFFARYLEGQVTQEISQEEAKKIGGGFKPSEGSATTHKFPSDLDEGLED
ncbi:MAG: microviridin/marinostatin family tricyclic proteinase inhibitor [Leptolyngbya sp. SIO1E4]|nr:microviridin/marinostatin family tricyclic proteinase inhibitor [Leptolyngbya sp. SIO1E4]